MENCRLILLSCLAIFYLTGCDLAPDGTGLTSSTGLVNKGVMSNAEVIAYKAGSLEFVKRTYTNSAGTFSFENMDYQGVLYVEVTTTSQTLSTCDSASGCGQFKNGLKLPGEYDANLDGTVDFGDRHYYNDPNFKLTSFINPDFENLENFGEFAVTPLTHLAAQRIISQGVGTSEGVDIVNAQVAELFGLSGVDITRIVPPDVTNTEKMQNATDAERMYSTLNAAVASSVSQTKDLVQVIDELTTSFVEQGGLVGNSANANNTTLASLQSLANDVAQTVETELSINMDTVQQIIQQEESENLNLTPDALVQPITSLEDADGDGLSNIQEESLGTNPNSPDSDKDGMPDGWEVSNGFDPLEISDGDFDRDFDGLTNAQEYITQTDPNNNNSNHDLDGILDGDEDSDGDGLQDKYEFVAGTSPVNSDSDGDGTVDGQDSNDGDDIPDEVEIMEGLALGQDDYAVDFDGDTISNGDEHDNGSNIHAPTPIVEFVSDAGIFSSSSSASGGRFTSSERRFVSSSLDIEPNDAPIQDGVADTNQSEDLLQFDLDQGNYSLPLRQYANTTDLISDGDVLILDSTPDGKRVLVKSMSQQIVNADTNNQYDLFVYDQFANKVKRIASPSQYDYGAYQGSISADGEVVAFTTMTAVPGTLDTVADASDDVYVINLQTDQIKLVTENVTGDGSSTGTSSHVQLSDDASRLIFISNSNDMNISGGSQGSDLTDDLYVHDVALGITKRVSIADSAAIDAYGHVLKAEVSSDGSSAIFYSNRDMLATGSQPAGYQLYYADLNSCFITAASLCSVVHITHPQGDVTNYSDSAAIYDYEFSAKISADGEYVVHKSDANNLNSMDVTSSSDVFLWDKQTKSNQLISQYVYDNTKTVYEADPTSRSFSSDLGVNDIFPTSDFTNIYLTMNTPHDLLPTVDLGECGELSCMFRIVLNLHQTDSDEDGLNDRKEIEIGSNPNDPDSDNDGLGDAQEVFVHQTSPVHTDSDEDGWDDKLEIDQGTLATVFDDSDGDGLSDAEEAIQGTLLNNPDSDNDGLFDGQELHITLTDPNVSNVGSDDDNDGLTDAEEINVHHTDWQNPDTDGGGVDDFNEVNTDGTDPLNPADDGGA